MMHRCEPAATDTDTEHIAHRLDALSEAVDHQGLSLRRLQEEEVELPNDILGDVARNAQRLSYLGVQSKFCERNARGSAFQPHTTEDALDKCIDWELARHFKARVDAIEAAAPASEAHLSGLEQHLLPITKEHEEAKRHHAQLPTWLAQLVQRNFGIILRLSPKLGLSALRR